MAVGISVNAQEKEKAESPAERQQEKKAKQEVVENKKDAREDAKRADRIKDEK